MFYQEHERVSDVSIKSVVNTHFFHEDLHFPAKVACHFYHIGLLEAGFKFEQECEDFDLILEGVYVKKH